MDAEVVQPTDAELARVANILGSVVIGNCRKIVDFAMAGKDATALITGACIDVDGCRWIAISLRPPLIAEPRPDRDGANPAEEYKKWSDLAAEGIKLWAQMSGSNAWTRPQSQAKPRPKRRRKAAPLSNPDAVVPNLDVVQEAINRVCFRARIQPLFVVFSDTNTIFLHEHRPTTHKRNFR